MDWKYFKYQRIVYLCIISWILKSFPRSVHVHVVFGGSVFDKSKQMNHFLLSFLNICWYSGSCRVSSDIKTVSHSLSVSGSSVCSRPSHQNRTEPPGVLCYKCIFCDFSFCSWWKNLKAFCPSSVQTLGTTTEENEDGDLEK